MEIEKAKELKKTFEERLLSAIIKYEQRTGLKVDEITITRSYATGVWVDEVETSKEVEIKTSL